MFPVAKHSCLISTDTLCWSHAQNLFPVAEKPRQSFAGSFSSFRRKSVWAEQLHLQRYSNVSLLVGEGHKPPHCPQHLLGWCSAITRELTRVPQDMQTRLVWKFLLPGFLGDAGFAQGESFQPCSCLRAPAHPAPQPAQHLPVGGAARTRVCLARSFWDGSCNGHHSRGVTALVPSLINARVEVMPPKEPRAAADLPDGLLYSLQPRPAVGEEVEHARQLHRGMASSLQHL